MQAAYPVIVNVINVGFTLEVPMLDARPPCDPPSCISLSPNMLTSINTRGEQGQHFRMMKVSGEKQNLFALKYSGQFDSPTGELPK